MFLTLNGKDLQNLFLFCWFFGSPSSAKNIGRFTTGPGQQVVCQESQSIIFQIQRSTLDPHLKLTLDFGQACAIIISSGFENSN